MNEYPKALFMCGWDDLTQCIVVSSEDEELSARANGYRGIDEPAPSKSKKQAVTE
jgi:hypothetical protein